MIFKETTFKGLYIIEPAIFKDDRGYFFESFNKKNFLDHGITSDFVQDNQSLSHQGVLRGLHFQKNPHAQGKLVRVLSGSVLDVVVDLRSNCETFGKHHKIILSAEKNNMLWIPEGFAHGFYTLENNTVFFYKCTGFYNKNAEDCLLWNDPTLEIDWGITNPSLSDKDAQGKSLKELSSLF